MLSVSTRLALGYTAMLVHACRHWRGLNQPLIRAALWRQLQISGVQALPMIALIAVLFGAVVPTQALGLLGADNDIVLKNVVWGGLRELGPLIVAVVLVVRSSVAIAAELALMRLRDGMTEALLHGTRHEEEVVFPRVIGLALSAAMLVAYFQVLALVAALVATALLLGSPISEELDYSLAAGVWWQVPLSIIKGAIFGLGIGAVSCYHGLHAQLKVSAVPKAVVAAGVGSIAFVLGADLFALSLLFV